MTTPTPHELAAAREIAVEIARRRGVDYPHVNIANIIAKHNAQLKENLKLTNDAAVKHAWAIGELKNEREQLLAQVKELQRKAKALDKILEVALQMRTHQLPTLADWVRFQFPSCAGNYHVEALLGAIESAMKGQ
jgi:hypothetical protein